jgi:hypothetical protein
MKNLKAEIKIGVVAFLSVALGFLTSCDTFETDPDISVPQVKLKSNELAVLSNSSAFIDLTTQVLSNVPVQFSITVPTQHGTLKDHGKGLLQYQPAIGSGSGTDSFEFAIYSLKNELIRKDTVIVKIESDTTKLPCGIYAQDDYVFGVKKGSSVSIHVLDNDFICSIDSGDVQLSVYRPDNSYPPNFGSASVVGNRIVYKANNSLNGNDKFIYKIQSMADPSKTGFGLAYLTSDMACKPMAYDDVYYFESLQDSTGSVLLPAFQNDSVCAALNIQYVKILVPPSRGTVSLSPGGFQYTPSDTVSNWVGFFDSFRYEVCVDAYCSNAIVTVKVKNAPKDSCRIIAFPDYIQIPRDTLPVISIHALENDVVCDSLTLMKIFTDPRNGTAKLSGFIINYTPDPLKVKIDSLIYQICDKTGCSSASVFIKRE